MTKVTYNKYSCAIRGMSREMMKMDGRDSAEYQIWEKKDIKVIFGKVKSQNDKLVNMTHLLQIINEQKRENWGVDAVSSSLREF